MLSCRGVTNARPMSTAVTNNEFLTALAKTCGGWKPLPNVDRVAEIGLAVSGGVDSMALVVLCSQLVNNGSLMHWFPTIANLKFQAFIVDHSVRCQSETEAKSVSKVLIRREIPTEILKMKWHVKEPSRLPNFETLARKQRFRLLGQACARRGIRALLLAHHEDDQAETIIARLITGHRGVGLVGIKSQSTIPECYGLHGVHESSENMDAPPVLNYPHSLPHQSNQLLTETGGIQVFRPLLNFSKSRLVATCHAAGMQWFEDSTNHDPTITTRNAIRHLYQKHKIPSALSKPNLIMLANTIRSNMERWTSYVNSLVPLVRIFAFDTTTGTMKVQFPCLTCSVNTCAGSAEPLSPQLAAELLRKFIYLVTPKEHVEISSLQGAVERVFPGIFKPISAQSQLMNSFTVAGLLFQPLYPSKTTSTTRSTLIHSRPNYPNPTWLISRQPCPRGMSNDFKVTIPLVQGLPSWFLFDGRFWMRIQNDSPSSNLIVRLLCPADLKPLLAQFNPTAKKNLTQVLAERAPGKVRWTLPAIFHHKINSSCSQPLSLPTLGLDVPGAEALGKWEVRYKKIYFDHMNLEN